VNDVQANIADALAPTGRLRASINLGNPVLARAGADGQPEGVSVDLARGLAQRLGVPVELLVFEVAARSVEAVATEQADIGFFAIDPGRGAAIAFTPPYLLIEGCYLVRDDSPMQHNDEVDAPGRRVVVGKGSAYDLHLTRAIRHAEIVRAPSSQTVVSTFVEQGQDVAAGVRQQLLADAACHGGLRLLPGHFMVIRQAMGCPRSRGDAAAAFLAAYVEEMKAGGFVAQALARHGVAGAAVAPAGDGIA
jgi:polar amino acid transport system substrate-binding protein